MLKSEIQNLKQADFYSILLFAIFKLKNIPEYSSLSQLSYILDQQNLLNFFEYFGGQTIRVPTIAELESLVYSLLLYQYVNIEHMNYDEAIKLIGHDSTELRQVKKQYQALCQILNNYSFNAQEMM